MIAIIRIRGQVKVKNQLDETFRRLRLPRKYSCIFIDEKEIKILDMFTQSGLTSSNGDAKKMISSGSLFINEIKVEDPQMIVSKKDFINGILLLRKWKKQYKIIRLLDA